MKKIHIICLLAAIALPGLTSSAIPACDNLAENGIFCIQDQSGKAKAVKTVYSCPMHPEVIQDKSGKCPKCGMDLKGKEVSAEVYSCPMHPEVVQDKKGKCPKCGMNLALKESPKKPAAPKK